MGVQGVIWNRGGTTSYGNGTENHELCPGFFVHEKTISAVKSVEFVIDRMYNTKMLLMGYHFSECSEF